MAEKIARDDKRMTRVINSKEVGWNLGEGKEQGISLR